ncbi:phosphate/phosphite/phosphonate ABC transporter substrate-binding protein [Aestuariispira insulae]|uniref:Phosphonate ABC transporter substrate-binding protein n=1 Tax=Aestuariispira insulae TaxID=1461337 RepID=A0A3D9HJW9_9PROT|nr:PhnD/SsuA/transferrin family substrate-binding protein [Aestuariispira insulae]RED49715.1 phosphonate ABC transporter substrate-binding protein [Aestuariispira insulae]
MQATASLPMYVRAETVDAHNAFWAIFHGIFTDMGGECPSSLIMPDDILLHWRSPDLFLSQTCGMPYRVMLHDHVTLVGTPDYGLSGCPSGHYQSVLVVRSDDDRKTLPDFKDARFAFNEPISQSGYSAAWFHTEAEGFHFTNLIQSGAHVKSARMVAAGNADIASLDAVTWQFIQEYDAFSDQLRVLDRTIPTPGLPLITAKGNDPEPIFQAFKTALTHAPADILTKTGIRDLVPIPKNSYLEIPTPPVPNNMG